MSPKHLRASMIDMGISWWRAQLPPLLIATVCIFGVGLAYDGGPFWIDGAVMNWIAGHRVAPLEAVSTVSYLFGPLLVSLWSVVVAAILIVRDRSVERALAVVTGVVGAAMITELIKLVVARPRPPMYYHPGITEMTYSYPSGHVTGTAGLALTTALVVTATASQTVRRLAVTLSMAITVLAALTRLYLGVHWLSDVVAAVAVATAAALTAPRLVHDGLRQAQRQFPNRLPIWARPTDPLATKEAAPHGR